MKEKEFDLRNLSGKEQYEYYQEQVETMFEKYIMNELKKMKKNIDFEERENLIDKLIELSSNDELLKKYDENGINIFLNNNEESKIKFAKEFIKENIDV